MTNPKPSRKRWRIALVAAVLFAAVGWMVTFPAYERHRAIQEIERVGGYAERTTVGPKWLSQWGFEIGRVVQVELDGTAITDDGLKHFSGLTNLEYLMLGGTRVTDDGVKMLRESLPNCGIEYDGQLVVTNPKPSRKR